MIARFIAWFLAQLETYEIRSRDGTELYLTRRWIFGHKTSKWALMLHQMHTPDPDTCHHDHPWWFWTLILKGGYFEHVTDVDGNVHWVSNRPGRLRYRPALHTHRIAGLGAKECWTLVLRGPYERSWGFHKETGWMHWQAFIDGRLSRAVAWCSDGLTQAQRLRGQQTAGPWGRIFAQRKGES